MTKYGQLIKEVVKLMVLASVNETDVCWALSQNRSVEGLRAARRAVEKERKPK